MLENGMVKTKQKKQKGLPPGEMHNSLIKRLLQLLALVLVFIWFFTSANEYVGRLVSSVLLDTFEQNEAVEDFVEQFIDAPFVEDSELGIGLGDPIDEVVEEERLVREQGDFSRPVLDVEGLAEVIIERQEASLPQVIVDGTGGPDVVTPTVQQDLVESSPIEKPSLEEVIERLEQILPSVVITVPIIEEEQEDGGAVGGSVITSSSDDGANDDSDVVEDPEEDDPCEAFLEGENVDFIGGGGRINFSLQVKPEGC